MLLYWHRQAALSDLITDVRRDFWVANANYVKTLLDTDDIRRVRWAGSRGINFLGFYWTQAGIGSYNRPAA